MGEFFPQGGVIIPPPPLEGLESIQLPILQGLRLFGRLRFLPRVGEFLPHPQRFGASDTRARFSRNPLTSGHFRTFRRLFT